MPSLTLFSPAFLIVVSALAGIQQTTPKKDIPALTRRALKSVVLVVASDATGKELRQGSGFVVSSDGKVVTNHHVMEGAESVDWTNRPPAALSFRMSTWRVWMSEA